ncbi:MAG: 2OG-Fe(II) oxygenase [Gammaproteobacteria bacterium]|nr:2OG-Fe(II) oxygenase [Gammaproteobacteria bacterium]MDH5653875.1 2OG-Fe(II) oxygenase [Gammaproteobacteria bacterium]
MNPSLLTRGPYDGDPYAQIISALREHGYIRLNNVFTLEQLQRLFLFIKQSGQADFHQAGVGRDQIHQVNNFIRRDHICWLDEQHDEADFYLEWMEELRLRLNRELFLGLFDYECHYAHYPKGAFYKKHLDAFQGSSNRRLTTILYLNPGWQTGDGGELLLYAADNQTLLETVQPTFGSMVIFLSEEFPHEVLPVNTSRYSLTGWFRINTSTGIHLDPPA